MRNPFRLYRRIWMVDFEYTPQKGGHPLVLCLVARDYWTRETIRVWRDELYRLRGPPFSIGPESLFVAYSTTAEFSCFLALDWPLPVNVLDLYPEYRNLTNRGEPGPRNAKLLHALLKYGLDSISAAEKQEMQELAQRGGPFTSEERASLLAYCETDVDALEGLLPKMFPEITL